LGASFLIMMLAAGLTGGCPSKKGRTATSGGAGKPDQTVADLGRPLPTTHEACARLSLPPPGKLKEITLAGVRMVPDGFSLKPAPDQKLPAQPRLLLGVLADTRHADKANLEQLTLVRTNLEAAGAHAILVLGGLDSTYEGTREALLRLKGKLPVLALAGDRASRSGFSGAVENLGAGMVDLGLARAILHPAATLISVPGYHLIHELLAGSQGCSYDTHDLDEVASLAQTLPAPRVLLAHGPPRGSGPGAIDRAFGQINAGDPQLTRLLEEGAFSFGLFAHLHEAGGRGVRLKSGAPVKPKSATPSLLLNVGSADATPHEDLAGSWSRGTLALVEFLSGNATYRVIKLDGASNSSETKRNN